MTDVGPLLLKAAELCLRASGRGTALVDPEAQIEDVGGACYLLVQAAKLVNAPPFNMVDDMAKLPEAFNVPTPAVRRDGTLLVDLREMFSEILAEPVEAVSVEPVTLSEQRPSSGVV